MKFHLKQGLSSIRWDEDMSKAFYFTPSEIETNADSVFTSKTKDLNVVDDKLYKMYLYGDDKVVGVKHFEEPPGFKYSKKVEEGEQGITMMVLFQRKDKGAPLTIIR